MIDLILKVERSGSIFWGQVEVNDNLIIEKSDNELKLIMKIKASLLEFEGLGDWSYTLTKQYI